MKFIAKLIYPIFRELMAMYDAETIPARIKDASGYFSVPESSFCESVNTTHPEAYTASS